MQSNNFYSQSLSSIAKVDEKDILSFSSAHPSGHGLAEYIQKHALQDELSGKMRTYLVRDIQTKELVGYYSLKAGLVSLNEVDQGERSEFDTLPAVELANYAINHAYRNAHPESAGCGSIIFRKHILDTIQNAAQYIGIKVLYIFSLPEEHLINNYMQYGFTRLPVESEEKLHVRLKPRYDQSCIFMYFMM